MRQTETTRGRALVGVGLVVLSAVCYGTIPVIAKVAFAAGTSLPVFLSWRFSIAACLMWAIVAVRRTPVPRSHLWVPLALMGAVGYAGQSAAFFTALSWLGAPTTALLLYTYPAIVTLAAAAFFRERLSARAGLAIVVAFTGTFLIVGRPDAHMAPQGVALALLSAFIYSGYILFGSKLFSAASPISTSAIVMTATASSFFLFSLASRTLAAPATLPQIGWIVLVAVIGTAVPILAFVAGMPRIGPSRASILSMFEPVVTVILAGVVLGESLQPLQLVGALCILASVAVLELRRTDGPAPI